MSKKQACDVDFASKILAILLDFKNKMRIGKIKLSYGIFVIKPSSNVSLIIQQAKKISTKKGKHMPKFRQKKGAKQS